MYVHVCKYVHKRAQTHTHTYMQTRADMIERKREHCFWKASDSVFITVLTATLFKKKTAQSAVVTCGASRQILKTLQQ